MVCMWVWPWAVLESPVEFALNVIIGHTEAGWVHIGFTRVFILDVLDKVPISVVITVKKKHEHQVLVLCKIMGLFGFCSGR